MPPQVDLVRESPGFLPSQQAPNDFVMKSDLRPFRVVSIETEVDGVAGTFAKTLYTCGLIPMDHVANYGWHPGALHKWPGFIKHDGSVTGGELVMELLNLADEKHAKSLQLCLNRLRVLEKNRHIQYNPNCGGHIHIDCNGFGLYDIWRLNETYGFIEDLVYRLAGAGKAYGHRSLFRGYDRAAGGGGYANPVKKGPFITVHDCYGKLQTQGRMSGLNYSGFFRNARAKCPCGKCTCELSPENEARVAQHRNDPQEQAYLREAYGTGDPKACTCKKQMNTVEWRVWNSQGNPRILFAWVALMQALFAYSYRTVGTPAYTTVEHVAPLSFTGKPLDKTDSPFSKIAKERAEFLFEELPLTPEEKDAIAYAFMRSECKEWGATFFKKLVNTPSKKPTDMDPYVIPAYLTRKITVPKEDAPAPLPFGKQKDLSIRAEYPAPRFEWRNDIRPGDVEERVVLRNDDVRPGR